MSDDADGFDPDAFARAVDGDADTGRSTTSNTSSASNGTTESHAAAEGTEPSDDVGSTSTLREMLLSTDPGDPLESVESPWDPERGGPTRIMRGVQKMTGVDGMPAIADVAIGLAETFDAVDLDDVDAGDEQTSDQEGGFELA